MNDDNWIQQKRHKVYQEILTAAWTQMRETGAGGLSLRGLARALGLTAPALYNYFPSKDELVTALILQAAEDFTQAQRTALRTTARTGLARLIDLGAAYRDWALARPQAFSVLFGDPIPGYTAPLDRVQPAMGCMLDPLVEVLADAQAGGELAWPLQPTLSPILAAELAGYAVNQPTVLPDVLYLAVIIASRVQGLVIMEVGRQLPPTFLDGAGLFQREMDRIYQEYRHK